MTKSTKAQIMKDAGIKVVLADGKERTIKFDLNALCELQEKFPDIEEAFSGLEKRDFKKIRTILYAVLAHEEDDSFTEKSAGSLVNMQNIGDVANALGEALTASVPEASEEGN